MKKGKSRSLKNVHLQDVLLKENNQPQVTLTTSFFFSPHTI